MNDCIYEKKNGDTIAWINGICIIASPNPDATAAITLIDLTSKTPKDISSGKKKKHQRKVASIVKDTRICSKNMMHSPARLNRKRIQRNAKDGAVAWFAQYL